MLALVPSSKLLGRITLAVILLTSFACNRPPSTAAERLLQARQKYYVYQDNSLAFEGKAGLDAIKLLIKKGMFEENGMNVGSLSHLDAPELIPDVIEAILRVPEEKSYEIERGLGVFMSNNLERADIRKLRPAFKRIVDLHAKRYQPSSAESLVNSINNEAPSFYLEAAELCGAQKELAKGILDLSLKEKRTGTIVSILDLDNFVPFDPTVLRDAILEVRQRTDRNTTITLLRQLANRELVDHWMVDVALNDPRLIEELEDWYKVPSRPNRSYLKWTAIQTFVFSRKELSESDRRIALERFAAAGTTPQDIVAKGNPVGRVPNVDTALACRLFPELTESVVKEVLLGANRWKGREPYLWFICYYGGQLWLAASPQTRDELLKFFISHPNLFLESAQNKLDPRLVQKLIELADSRPVDRGFSILGVLEALERYLPQASKAERQAIGDFAWKWYQRCLLSGKTSFLRVLVSLKDPRADKEVARYLTSTNRRRQEIGYSLVSEENRPYPTHLIAKLAASSNDFDRRRAAYVLLRRPESARDSGTLRRLAKDRHPDVRLQFEAHTEPTLEEAVQIILTGKDSRPRIGHEYLRP